MPSLSSSLRGVTALALCLAVSGSAGAADTDPDGAIYQPSADPLADVQEALSRAGETNRLALVVLGANWCHDSRALAARLQRSPLKDVVQQHYELVMVDVGFYEQGRAVTQRFGVAHYYATPTVLIVDPSDGRLVNDKDRHIWGNAYRISMSESVEYFEKYAANRLVPSSEGDSEQLKALYAEIDQFEQQQADRVAAGYAVVGPMLEAYKAGNAPDEFDARWDELSEFRNSIPGDIKKLRDEARLRVAESEQDIQLLYPEYPLLSWESED